MRSLFLIALCFCIQTTTKAQGGWGPVRDTLGTSIFSIKGGPVRALYPDTFYLYIGGEFDTSFWDYPLVQWNFLSDPNGDLTQVACPPMWVGTDYNPSVWSLAGAHDVTQPSHWIAAGGRFTGLDMTCIAPAEIDPQNLAFWRNTSPNNSLYFYTQSPALKCMDTVFAIDILVDKVNFQNSPDMKTYVAAQCVFCDCNFYTDSTQYIGFFDKDPYGYNFMQGGTNGPVYAIEAVDSNNVFAGGIFDSAGVIYSRNIAKWNSIGWDSLGAGTNGVVRSLLWKNGLLYAGGEFSSPANNIAVWNGVNWSGLGSGTNGSVNALTWHNGELYIGGAFTQAGGNSVNNVARWDGIQWHDVSGGRNDVVYALASFAGDLYAGGRFTGGVSDTSALIARHMDSSITSTQYSDNSGLQLTAFPNPADGNLQFASDKTVFCVEVFNSMGMLVKSIQPNARTGIIDLNQFQAGVYMIRFKIQNGYFSRQVIIR